MSRTLLIEPGMRTLTIDSGELLEHLHIQIKEGAHVTCDQYLHGTVTVTVEAHASFTLKFLCESDTPATSTYRFILAGEQAHVTLDGRLRLEKAAAHGVTIEQIHRASCTFSSVELKAVVQDEAVLTYQGTITIHEEAAHSEAFQTQKNLIVGAAAQVQSVPNLQVLTHEVRCGHGSAVSYVNDDHLFYLQSRGLSAEQAKQKIIAGFLYTVDSLET